MGHLLGLNPARFSLFRMHRPLHVLGALKFKPTEAEAAIHLPSTARLTFSSSGCRVACVAEALVLYSVSQQFEGRVRHTVVFRRFGSAAEGAVIVSV